MKLSPNQNRQNASAVVIAVILLGIMTTFIIGNSLALRNLKTELNLIEAKQLKNASHAPINSNAPPRQPAP